ncbi:hypothetical protein E6Q11_05540 [Candidatus Dojkabacteria bacterium]|uniref:Uncharacterized protein n=1 Tax=Candidatus Dojkabacteria bacterium TaxID=2099670 RepID=A0A5C7J3E1_9BACT|nr:MAG: hypothetical protein E6Q11_05540 [Candidatus Dojkabacteria bacterium]
MKMNLKILALFAFSTFVFAQAGERIQNAIEFLKDKASLGKSALEFAKNNKTKALLRKATGLYAIYLLKPKNTIKTLKNATFFNGKQAFISTWFVKDEDTVFGTNKHSLVGKVKVIEEIFPLLENKGFGPLTHVVQRGSRGEWLMLFLAVLVDRKIPTN